MSNKLDATLEVTSRNFQWDVASRNQGGRVIEILSEHTCQGMLQGYTLTGRTGLFPSYEAFLGIVHTMMVQYAKFAKMVSRSWKFVYHCARANPYTGSRNPMATRRSCTQLPRNINMDTTRTQRFLAPESLLHRCRPEPQTDICEGIPPT